MDEVNFSTYPNPNFPFKFIWLRENKINSLRFAFKMTKTFSGNDEEDVEEWLDKICSAAKIWGLNAEEMCNLALLQTSGAAYRFWKYQSIYGIDREFRELSKAFMDRFKPTRSTDKARQDLENVKQGERESLSTYYDRVQQLTLDTRICITVDIVINAFVNGLRDTKVKADVLASKPKTMAEAYQRAAN